MFSFVLVDGFQSLSESFVHTDHNIQHFLAITHLVMDFEDRKWKERKILICFYIMILLMRIFWDMAF